MNRTALLLAALLLLACAILSGGCLSGTSVPGPATAFVPSVPFPGWLPDPWGLVADAPGSPLPVIVHSFAA
jgi:hypothetical protein